MGLDRVRTQLEKFGLAGKNDEMSVGVLSLPPFFMFGDEGGEHLLIAYADDVQREFNAIAYRMGSLSKDGFWSGSWLAGSPRYRGLDELWRKFDSPTYSISVSVPKSQDRCGIGRAKRINRDTWLFESDTGEYALVPERDTVKWRKEI